MESRTKLYKVIVTDENNNSEVKEYPANGATHAWYVAKELNPNCKIEVVGY